MAEEGAAGWRRRRRRQRQPPRGKTVINQAATHHFLPARIQGAGREREGGGAGPSPRPLQAPRPGASPPSPAEPDRAAPGAPRAVWLGPGGCGRGGGGPGRALAAGVGGGEAARRGAGECPGKFTFAEEDSDRSPRRWLVLIVDFQLHRIEEGSQKRQDHILSYRYAKRTNENDLASETLHLIHWNPESSCDHHLNHPATNTTHPPASRPLQPLLPVPLGFVFFTKRCAAVQLNIVCGLWQPAPLLRVIDTSEWREFRIRGVSNDMK
ncbi:uncharacterized protein LOC129399864 [Sorex araneus]|uniref:uncharacterized protein LOC129399864 n=1 Tax=Sorex araneus TaxID=42254 RepID=UPI0024339F39|nr:uncharacterized protein LOC129399864 [Sorex araneus]